MEMPPDPDHVEGGMPDDGMSLRDRLSALRESGTRDQALRLEAEHPESVKVHRAVARFYWEADLRAEQARALERILQLRPDDRKARLQLVDALSEIDRPAEALAALTPLAQAEPTSTMLLATAKLRRRLGREQAAEDDLSRAVAANPWHDEAWDELVDVLESAGRRAEAREAAATRDRVPRKLSTAEVVRRIDEAHPEAGERFVVNIGCHDGRSADDPCYELFEGGYPGLAVDSADYPALHENLPQPSVRKLLNTPVTPKNVAEVLAETGCPLRPSLLKIDIDSFDGVVLAAALEAFEPNVIQIEVNPEIPPPLRFAIQYDPRHRGGASAGFYGCSVAYVASLCRPFGYELLQIDFSRPPFRQDVILVKRDHLRLWGVEGPVDERSLWLAEPTDLGLFYQSGVDTVRWRSEEDFHALFSEVWDVCVAASLRRSNEVLPFSLELGR